MGRRRRGVGLVAVVVVAATACSGGGDNPFDSAAEQDTTTTTGPPAEPLEAVWTTPGQFVTRPKLVAGLVVSLLAQDGGLALVAHDPATGAEMWRRPSVTSSIRPQVVVEVPTDGQRVFHFTPAEDGTSIIEAVDVPSGQPAWQTQGRDFVDPVDFCDEISGPLCTVKVKSTGDTALWRLAPDTGVLNEMDDVNGRGIGARLYDVDDGPDISRVVGGAIVWQRPEKDLFGGAAVTTNNGWYFREVGDLVVGTLGNEQQPPADGDFAVPPSALVGIVSATGETRWVAEGDPTCGWRVQELNLLVGGQPPWVRCRITGTISFAGGQATGWSFSSVVLEGYDPATGTATWTLDVGAASAFGDPSKLIIRQGPTRFVVQRDDGSLLGIDVETGETSEPNAGEPGWCLSENRWSQDPARFGHPFTTPCDLGATAQPAPVGPDDGVGAVAGDTFVWMDAGGLHGARIVAQ